MGDTRGEGKRRRGASTPALTARDVERSWRRYHLSLFNYFRRCGALRETAEDLTQGVFVALLEDPGRFDPARGELQLFLFGIARNLRRAWQRRSLKLVPRSESGAGPKRGTAPEDLHALREALAALPEEQREALVLREFHGLTYEEIARVQEVQPGTVRSRLARARDELRRRLRTKAGTTGDTR